MEKLSLESKRIMIERFEKDNRALFEGMLSSGRYAGLRLNCYMNIVNK